jgi:hypothetical protein
MTTKRISAELVDDNAIKLEILYAALRLNAEAKKDADRLFCEIAALSVEKIIEMCKKETGVQYPSHSQLMEFLTGRMPTE